MKTTGLNNLGEHARQGASVSGLTAGFFEWVAKGWKKLRGIETSVAMTADAAPTPVNQ